MLFEQLNQGSCRAYLIGDEKSRQAILIDPRLEFVPNYLVYLEKNGLKLTHVIDTHTHADHISGATLLAKENGASYLMHRASPVSTLAERIEDGFTLELGQIKVSALYTPGHSKDSVSILVPGKILTGDALFLDDGGAGRDDLYGGDSGEHWESLQRLGALDERLLVLPGHEYRGYAPSTLAQQKRTNPMLRYENKQSYVDFTHNTLYGAADWMKPIVAANIAGVTEALAEPLGADTACEVMACEPMSPCEPVKGAVSFAGAVLSVPQLLEKLNSTEPPIVLDVREEHELLGELGRLDNIIHIPVGELTARLSELVEYKHRELIVVCRTSNRSLKAGGILSRAGFIKVGVLAGGMHAYRGVENSSSWMVDQPIYLDHAATTYLDPRVKAVMEPFWETDFGNPSSTYSLGRRSNDSVETARARIAELLKVEAQEIIFTAGGTESINLAIFGVVERLIAQDSKPHIITSAIEHSAVLKSVEALQRRGCAVTILSVDREGFIDLRQLEQAITPATTLVSIMYANNEIGTVQPIAQIGKLLRKINETREPKKLPRILFHSDACQGAGALSIDVQKLGVDLLTINGSKLYGPKQTGLLYCRTGVALTPIIYGGGQEHSLRSGTENVPGIVGLAKALELAQQESEAENYRLRELRQFGFDWLKKEVPEMLVNGAEEDSASELRRLPNNINVSFLGVNGENLLVYLDRHGICVSTGSACSAKHTGASHVLTAIACPPDYINGSLRITLGKRTNKNQLQKALMVVADGVRRQREKRV